jgi:S1-C subfamily serine protease
VTLARRERTSAEDTNPVRWRGLTLVPMTPENRRALNLAPSVVEAPAGLIIARVRPASPAERAGLKPGTLITSIGDQSVDTLRHFRQVIRAIRTQPARIATQDGTIVSLPAN